MVVKVVRVLLAYAVDNEYETIPPRIKLFKLGEYRAWSDAECAAFEARWPTSSMQRRAYMLAKFTGQRCGDIARMTLGHRKDGTIRVVKQKIGAELLIREHAELTAELALGGSHMALLTKADGSALDGDSLSMWFASAIDAAGLPDDCVLHGLRKTAARMLADVGCSTHEIISITGHRSLKEVERYTRAASQKNLASAAILKLEQNVKEQQVANAPPSSNGKLRPRG